MSTAVLLDDLVVDAGLSTPQRTRGSRRPEASLSPHVGVRESEHCSSASVAAVSEEPIVDLVSGGADRRPCDIDIVS